MYCTLLVVTVNITPMHMMNAAYAKKVTGAEDLTDEQKHQIQEQQKVRAQFHHMCSALTESNTGQMAGVSVALCAD